MDANRTQGVQVKYSPDQARDYHGRWTEQPGGPMTLTDEQLEGAELMGWGADARNVTKYKDEPQVIVDRFKDMLKIPTGRLAVCFKGPHKGEVLYAPDFDVPHSRMVELYDKKDTIDNWVRFSWRNRGDYDASVIVGDNRTAGEATDYDKATENIYWALDKLNQMGVPANIHTATYIAAGYYGEQGTYMYSTVKAWMLKYSPDQARDYHGRWTSGTITPGGDRTEPDGKNERIHGSNVRIVHDCRDLIKNNERGLVAVCIKGANTGTVLSTPLDQGHAQMIRAFDPKDKVDNYVRYGIYSDHLEAYIDYAGVVIDRAFEPERTKAEAIDNIWRATDKLVKMGLPGQTKLVIYDGFSVWFRTTAKTWKYSPDQARDYHGRWTSQDHNAEAAQAMGGQGKGTVVGKCEAGNPVVFVDQITDINKLPEGAFAICLHGNHQGSILYSPNIPSRYANEPFMPRDLQLQPQIPFHIEMVQALDTNQTEDNWVRFRWKPSTMPGNGLQGWPDYAGAYNLPVEQALDNINWALDKLNQAGVPASTPVLITGLDRDKFPKGYLLTTVKLWKYSPNQPRDYHGRWTNQGEWVYPKTFEREGEADTWGDQQGSMAPDSVNEDERNACHSYKEMGFHMINGSLRKKHPLDETARMYCDRMIPELDDAIEKCTVPETLEVYRGFYANEFPKGLKGKIFTDKGFVSTSLAEEKGRQFAKNAQMTGRGYGLMRIIVPKGSHGAWMEKLAGDWMHEAEVLLPRDTRFRIISDEVKDYGDHSERYIKAAVIP